MKIIHSVIQSKILFFLLVSFTILGLNITPLIIHARHSPPDRNFTLVHNNIQDFFFYQSLMNQGARGAWLISDPFTLEPHQKSPIFAYFLWFGKIANLLSIPFPIMYHILRFTFGFLLLLVSYFLLLKFKFPYPRLTFLFFVFAAPLLHDTLIGDQILKAEYMHWWTGMDPIRRAAYLPHHMIGAVFLVLSVLLILKYFSKPTIQHFLWLALFALILGFIHTPSLFIILVFLPPSVIIYAVMSYLKFNKKEISVDTKNLKLKIYNFIGLLVYWIIGLFVILFMVSQTNKGFPWNQYVTWEKNIQFPLDKELIGAMGILFPFAAIGMLKALFSRKFEHILTACWLIIPFLLIPFAKTLSISNIRLIQGVPYLPLAILAVFGFKTVLQFIKSSSKILPMFLNSKLKSQNSKPQLKSQNLFRNVTLENCFIVIFLIIFAVFTYPSYVWSMKDQIREYWTLYSNVYIDKRLYRAFDYLNNYLPAKSRTISTFYAGNYLPAFTDTTSFAGHFGYTYNVSHKEELINGFLSDKMTVDEAKKLLKDFDINVVFQGYEEKPLFNNYLYPTLLKPVYDREGITIYTPNL